MKRLSQYILRLKPYKRKYRLFCLVSFAVCAFVFLQLMLILSEIVPHVYGGYYYFIHGFHSLVQGYSSEHHASLGFVIAGFLLGYLPFIAVIPFIYFTLANFIIFEKLSERFPNTVAAKYKKWALMSHFGEIAVTTLVITGIIFFAGGGNPFNIFSGLSLVPYAFEDGGIRMVGIAAILHFAVGYVFALIDIFWIIGLLIIWVFRQIGRFFSYIGKMISDWKRRRMEEKLARKSAKVSE